MHLVGLGSLKPKTSPFILLLQGGEMPFELELIGMIIFLLAFVYCSHWPKYFGFLSSVWALRCLFVQFLYNLLAFYI